ncbi:hypothetical protein IFM89_028815 [Coptis chinensis]|uniref:Uncharacterized protein n=1 Tax=Coptis chinensis TaxID=261450 RepID=A0A835LG14_9MAGN|nr:hypothetical protein IFM89_028815 [Coptis chinensis]
MRILLPTVQNYYKERSWPKIEVLNLAANSIYGMFPSSVGNMTSLVNLDLFFNDIEGGIPSPIGYLCNLKSLNMFGISTWLHANWVLRFQRGEGSGVLGLLKCNYIRSTTKSTQGYVDLSSNLFGEAIPLPVVEIELLELSNNQFSGTIPTNIGQVLPDLIFFSLSHNHITGEIPASIGDMLLLQVLDLSSNNLTGEIPPNLQYCSYMKVLDLDSNNFYGTIPSSFGQLSQLQSLHLSNNRLSGELPPSLQSLTTLKTLDLGNNHFFGNIPLWIGEKLSSLKILRLSLPPNITGFKAMLRVQNAIEYRFFGKYRGVYYEESLIVTTKGQTQRYTEALSLVTSIDLSGNHFHGDFPEAITKLRGLVVLNTSRNHFSGHIPSAIAELHELSSFDISSNEISGVIPSSMSSMSYLSYLNLSNNNFSGKIPFEGQMTTFDASAFSGNLRLCGPPLSTKCDGTASDKGGTTEVDFTDNWFYLSMGLGFVLGLLVPLAIFAIKRPWSDAYFGFMDKILEKPLH